MVLIKLSDEILMPIFYFFISLFRLGAFLSFILTLPHILRLCDNLGISLLYTIGAVVQIRVRMTKSHEIPLTLEVIILGYFDPRIAN